MEVSLSAIIRTFTPVGSTFILPKPPLPNQDLQDAVGWLRGWYGSASARQFDHDYSAGLLSDGSDWVDEADDNQDAL